MQSDSNAHPVLLMCCHLVLVVKYRRQVFDGNISDRAKEIFEYAAQSCNITLREWNHDKDHVCILFKAHPDVYKNASGRLLKKELPAIRQKITERTFSESKLLPADYRRSTFGCVRFIYNKMSADKIDNCKVAKDQRRNQPKNSVSFPKWLRALKTEKSKNSLQPDCMRKQRNSL